MADRASAQAVVDALWKQHPGAATLLGVAGGWPICRGGRWRTGRHRRAAHAGRAAPPGILEGVLATVVRYFGGVKLGAGGLVRAYTDTVAQALLTAPKITLQRMKTLQCQVPYALEGMIRREVEAAGAQLLDVQHGSLVSLQLRLPGSAGAGFRTTHQRPRAGPRGVGHTLAVHPIWAVGLHAPSHGPLTLAALRLSSIWRRAHGAPLDTIIIGAGTAGWRPCARCASAPTATSS